MSGINSRISDPETLAITKESAGYRLQGGVPGRRCGDCRWYEGGLCTRGIIGLDRTDADDVCDEFRRNHIDGSMSSQEVEATVSMSALKTRSMELFINRVAEDPQTGERRWFSTSSGVKRDLYGERMSIGLFKDFVKRIEKREAPPEPFTSKAWNGGLPYLGVAHYLDLEGFGIAGDTTKVWRDGTHLKMRGTFNDTPVGKAAYGAIRRDIENDLPPDQRVRVSIAFVDWGHEHEGIGQFERKSLTDRCAYCEAGKDNKIYRKGHLVHLALTRQPAYPEADIKLEERSMSQRKLDAASIVGGELADELEKKAAGLTERSANIDPNAIVIRQEEEMEEEKPMDGEDGDEAEEEDKEKKAEAEEGEKEMVYESLGGALSLDEADEYLTRRSKDVPLLDSWAIFASVLANIAGEDKREPIYKTVGEFQERLDIMALRALMKVSDLIEKAEGEAAPEVAPEETGGTEEVANEPTPVSEAHPLDEAMTVLRDSFDKALAERSTVDERLQALQEPLNQLAGIIRKSVSGEAMTAESPSNEVIVKAISDAVAPLQAEIATLQARLAARTEIKPPAPVRRALSLNPAGNTLTERSTSKYPDLKSVIRRSVGIRE